MTLDRTAQLAQTVRFQRFRRNQLGPLEVPTTIDVVDAFAVPLEHLPALVRNQAGSAPLSGGKGRGGKGKA